MMAKKDSWAELSSLWQEEKGIDPDVLARSVTRKTWSMRLMAGTELVAGVLGVGTGLWLMIRYQDIYEVGLGAFIVLFAGVGTFATLWVRRGSWQTPDAGVTSQLRLTLKRAHSGVKLALVNLWAIIPATLLIGSILVLKWEGISRVDPAKQNLIILLVVLGVVALLGTAIWGFWYKARKEREIVRLTRLLADLEDDAGE